MYPELQPKLRSSFN